MTRSPPCGRSSRGRPGARARSSSSRWSGTWPRRSASSYAFVAEFAGVATRVRTLAYWGKGRDPRERRIRPGRDPLRGRGARGALPPSPRGPGEVPARPGADRPGDRELPRRAAARRRGERARAPGGLRRAAHAAPSRGGSSSSGSSPPGPPSSSSGCGSRSSSSRASGATATSTRRRRTPTWRSGRDRRLLSVNHRATQLLGYPAAELVGSSILAHLRRHARRPGPGRASAPTRASPARRSPGWSWRCAGGTGARSGSASG